MYASTPPEYKEFEDDRYAFSEKTVRRSFIRKVYAILMIQMLISLGFIAWSMHDIKTRIYFVTHQSIGIIAALVMFAVLIILMCCGDVRRKCPMNIIFLTIFTLAESFLLATVTAIFDSKEVMIAVGITALVFLALTIFSFQTKYDFTLAGGFLTVALMVLLVFGIVVLLFPGKLIMMVYSSIGAIIFGFYIVYDTQLLMGGHRFTISPEEYIFAVLTLYLDIINFLLDILTIIGLSRN